MIKAEFKDMRSHIEINGSPVEILIEISVLMSRLVTQAGLSEKGIKTVFELTLEGVKHIKEVEENAE